MSETKPWYWKPAALNGLGLRLEVVRRFGKRAFWAVCRVCGEPTLAIACEDCTWDLGSLILVANHVQALRDVRKGLVLFGCANGCNRAMIERSPAAVLLAQATEAAHEHLGRSREPVPKGKRRAPTR